MIIQQFILYCWVLHHTALHVHLHILICGLAVHGQMNLRSLLTSDVVADEKRQILSGSLDIFHFIEDISRQHSGFLGRGVLEHLDRRDDSCVYILAHLNTNSAVSSGSLLIQACVLVLIVIYGIRIVQRGHVTAVDPIFRRSVLCLFFLSHVLIEQEVLIDQCLHILKLRRDLVHIQLSAGCLRSLCALALRCTPSYGPDPRCNTYDCKSGECCHKDSDKDAFPKFIFCLFLFQCLFSFTPGQPDLIR